MTSVLRDPRLCFAWLSQNQAPLLRRCDLAIFREWCLDGVVRNVVTQPGWAWSLLKNPGSLLYASASKLKMSLHELPRGSSSGFELRLFGPFTALKHGQRLPALRTRKGESLLALLVLHRGREVARAVLAGTLWPESPDVQARYNLRRSLSDLRRALGSEANRLHSGESPQKRVA